MKAMRISICVLIAFEVLSFGGVEPWSYTILEVGTAVLFLLWGILAVRQRHTDIHWNWLYLPVLGLCIFGIAQYAFGLSVYPYLTKVELLKWSAYGLLCFLTTESFRTAEEVKRFVWFLVIFGFAVSLFAIIQHFTFNGEIYWTVPLRAGGSPFGPYVNRDNFAGFVELVAPLGLAFLFFRAARREHFALLLLFTFVPIGAAILSASRGGIIGLVFELLLLAFLARARRIESKQIVGVTALALVAGTFIVWLGATTPLQRFEQLTPREISQNLRVSMYRDTWRIFIHHPVAGTGLGTLVAVFPRYSSFYIPDTIVDHAHNDYLELLADTGVVGGFCGLAFIVLLFWRGFGNVQVAEMGLPRAIFAGSLTACAGLLLHSLVDFNLHIPANALIFLLLASLATMSLKQSQESGPLRPPEDTYLTHADRETSGHGAAIPR